MTRDRIKDYIDKKLEAITPADFTEFQRSLLAAADEAERAHDKFGDFASLHEAYAVLLEEVDELWDHVKEKQSIEVECEVHGDLRAANLRDKAAIRHEAIQIAGIAMRIAADAERLARK